jgi:hypothetical protein
MRGRGGEIWKRTTLTDTGNWVYANPVFWMGAETATFRKNKLFGSNPILKSYLFLHDNLGFGQWFGVFCFSLLPFAFSLFPFLVVLLSCVCHCLVLSCRLKKRTKDQTKDITLIGKRIFKSIKSSLVLVLFFCSYRCPYASLPLPATIHGVLA